MIITRHFCKLLLTGIVLLITACNSADTDKSASIPANNSSGELIISERIDGPANIRDTVNGKLLFVINDNVPVSANVPINNWLQVGVRIDLNKKQLDSLFISKGSKIFVNGKEAGKAIEDIHLGSGFEGKDGRLIGELIGYSSSSNIKSATIPENILSAIINDNKSALTKDKFDRFLTDFEFTDYDSLLPNLKGYGMEDNWIDDPSPLARFWLLFEGDQLFGVFHRRPLNLTTGKTTKVERGFYFTALIEDEKRNKELVKAFNSFINSVD